ncbi:hypothetical protein CRENBAI_014166 [Crenichthys baileyi]|uniref:Ig-like domain-containing protein n=1 Tax=Crenichthys baileyi TaxID=28760 RepID=A0AAV9R1N4_9TELE
MKVLFMNVLLLCSLCEAEVSKISEPVSVQILKLRESATFECYIKSLVLKIVWYKLTAGRRLQLVATGDSQSNHSVIAEEFQRRFSVKFDSINSHLRISATPWGDVGTYFCGVMGLHKVQFGSGTFLLRKGLKLTSDSVPQQPEPHSVHSGHSLTLCCTVHSDGLTSGSLNMADQVSTLIIFIIVTICALGVYLGSLVWILDETNCCFGSCAEPLASSQTRAEVQHEEHVQTNISKGQENTTWTECVYINKLSVRASRGQRTAP